MEAVGPGGAVHPDELPAGQVDVNYIENLEQFVGQKMQATVTEVDRVKRIVKASDGTLAEYDRLLLCTGSNPFILPVPGKDLEGVIAYRDIADTNAMIDAATKYQHAVVIGGGLRVLGLAILGPAGQGVLALAAAFAVPLGGALIFGILAGQRITGLRANGGGA